MISVVVPAHNEAGVIGRCLASLSEGADPGEIEILVVCNACTDDTARIARAFDAPVRVLEIPEASKPKALNLGDHEAHGFPRFYLDADIELPLDSVRKVASVLRDGGVLAAAPRMKVVLDERPWSVRAYFAVWMQTPYVTGAMLGCGVYAVSEKGRERFDQFPDIIADDCFVRLSFAPHEKTAVEDAWFTMHPPRTLRDLIHINVRRREGQFEMRARHPAVTKQEATHQRGVLWRMTTRPRLWPALAIYAYAKLATVLILTIRRRRGLHREWMRDDTSRSRAASDAPDSSNAPASEAPDAREVLDRADPAAD